MSDLDFSNVNSREAADALVARGELARLLFVPERFGGTDTPLNTVCVPAFVVIAKDKIDAEVIMPLVREGAVSQYVATPQYQGNSFIPNAIVVTAVNPRGFEAVIKIWGDALKDSAT